MFGPFAARYKILQVEVVQMFGISYEDAREGMRDVFNFEKDLANVSSELFYSNFCLNNFISDFTIR